MHTYVPLSQRSPDEIRDQGEIYQEMAATARTPEAKRGLEALAVRLAALAEQLEAGGQHCWRQRHAQDGPRAAP
jgi:hypothetical protein